MNIPSQFNQFNRNKKIILNSTEEYHCCYCGVKLEKDKKIKKNPNMITIDHKISRNDGGKNSMDNLTTCCSRCNNLKGSDYTYKEFKDIVKSLNDRENLYHKTMEYYRSEKQKRKNIRENIVIFNLATLFLITKQFSKGNQ